MFFYEGQTCPVCGQFFGEADDIVTCPECGAQSTTDQYDPDLHPLLGWYRGDTVEVLVPSGATLSFKILEINK